MPKRAPNRFDRTGYLFEHLTDEELTFIEEAVIQYDPELEVDDGFSDEEVAALVKARKTITAAIKRSWKER